MMYPVPSTEQLDSRFRVSLSHLLSSSFSSKYSNFIFSITNNFKIGQFKNTIHPIYIIIYLISNHASWTSPPIGFCVFS